MSMLDNSKMMLGAALALLVLSAPLSMLSTAGVEAAVEDEFETFTKDNACANDDCTEAESDWASSTSQRDYYAWDITNVDDVMENGTAPVYEKVGPFTYDITYKRTILDYDEDAGTMTYNSVKSFECAEDSEFSCDTPVSQLNIAFRAQTIGATGTAVNGIMEATKAGFAVGMMGQDLNTTQAGVATAASINSTVSAVGGATFAMGGYAAWAGLNPLDAASLPMADFTAGIDKALSNTSHPFDANFNISLLEDLGPVAFIGLGEPEEDVSAIAADPMNSVTMQRATTYGYVALVMVDHDANASTPDQPLVIDTDGDSIPDTAVPDYNQTSVRDRSLYTGVGGIFLSYGGGSDVDPSDNDGSADRMENLLGVSFDGVNVTNLLTAGHLTDNPTGLIATNAAGTGFGIAAFLAAAGDGTAMSTYGLTAEQLGEVAGWASGWATSVTSVQLGLLGGTGTMNAAQFVNASFGGEDPINGGYLTNSLNMGGLWGTALTGSSGAPAVDLNPALAGNILYGDLGLATANGAGLFLYGELSGMTPPIDFTTMGPGTPMTWNTSTISMLYGGIDANTIGALRTLMMGPIFGDFVPGFLQDTFMTTPYLTQPVSSWLFGWRDTVSAFIAGNASDPTLGWSSLETNETYYGSGGLPNGDGTNYTVCTGESSSCDVGETLLEDGSTELPWRSTAMFNATFGLISVEYLDGTTGGFLTGSGDKVDVSGYAIADVTCSGTSEVKNIPADTCSASVDPLTRSIQAKLLGVGAGLVAATPSALPVYLGSDISMSSEELSGLIIAGESTTTFYLDTRDASLMTTAPTMDNLTKVFEIKSSSTIEDDDAEKMESSIVQNQNGLTYWTNFDVPTDFIALILYLGTIACLFLAVMAMNKEEE